MVKYFRLKGTFNLLLADLQCQLMSSPCCIIQSYTHTLVTLSFCIFPAREEWVPTCWKRDGLKRILRLAFCLSQCFWRTQTHQLYLHTSPQHNIPAADPNTSRSNYSVWGAHRVLLGVAHLDPHDVVQQPVDGFVFVEHEHELHDERQVQRLEHLPCQTNRDTKTSSFISFSKSHIFFFRITRTINKQRFIF